MAEGLAAYAGAIVGGAIGIGLFYLVFTLWDRYFG